MAHDYANLTPEQLAQMEREAYSTGDTDRAALLAALMDLIDERECFEDLEDELRIIKRETENHEAYKSFFEDCFDRLDGHYPCPSVTSAYDKSVIFDAIDNLRAALVEAEERLTLLIARDDHKLLDVVARDKARRALTASK